MSQQFEIRTFINETRDLIAKVQGQIPGPYGWSQTAVHLRQLLSYLDNVERACDDDKTEEAIEWLAGLKAEILEFQDTNQDSPDSMGKGFEGVACWLWEERQFAVPYRDGWFDGLATLTELDTTLPAYCQYADERPSTEWCQRNNGELWLHESHLYPLVQSADVQFQLFMVQKIKHMLRESQSREHHQASLHAACPEIHDMMFPETVAIKP